MTLTTPTSLPSGAAALVAAALVIACTTTDTSVGSNVSSSGGAVGGGTAGALPAADSSAGRAGAGSGGVGGNVQPPGGAAGTSDASVGGAGTSGGAGASGNAGVAGADADASDTSGGRGGASDASGEAGRDAGMVGADASDAADVDAGCPSIDPPDSGSTITGVEGSSCSGGLQCNGVSCCQNSLVPAGEFPMGRSYDGTDAWPEGNAEEQPEHLVFVSDFFLDTFEVTVGRFRQFVDTYDGLPPPDGAGAHPMIVGSGWQSIWNAQLPDSRAQLMSNLKCGGAAQTWTDAPGPNESKPLSCASWWEAFAFCIWDGGRLPTEAEFEKAAAGGDQNRLFPWGQEQPNDCIATFDGTMDLKDVGATPGNRARWGHLDLAGSLWEWTLDWHDKGWYTGGGSSCSDCANLTPALRKVTRGGAWSTVIDHRLRAAYRSRVQPKYHQANVGFRCARSP